MAQGELAEIVSFGDWVRRRRKVLDLTQAALAKQVGCAVITIKKIEQDERRPSPQMARLLADQLAIPGVIREDFIRMARGQFTPSLTAPKEALRPPLFLQQAAQPSTQAEPHFVAREAELAQLEAHLRLALAGQGRVVFIMGEAGGGKTTLMAEFARRAQAAQSELIVASGNYNAQAGVGDPHLPFRDLMSMLTGDLETRWRAGTISKEQVLRLWTFLPTTLLTVIEHGPHLIDSLIPGASLARRVMAYASGGADWLDRFQPLLARQEAGPDNLEQNQLLEELTQVLRELATECPLLLLLDDLQWIDDASNNLLFHLGRRLPGSRILIVAAYRLNEVDLGRPAAGGSPDQESQHPLKPVINEFIRHYGKIQIDLSQFEPSAGRAFIDALLDREPNRLGYTFREKLYRHTRGQPLFTVELLRNMQESGHLIRAEDGRWTEGAAFAAHELPVRVEAVIEQRIARLDERLQEILTVASVEGELFTVQVVSPILGIDERLVLRQLGRDLAQRHRLVREHKEIKVGQRYLNRYQFGHVLFQKYLYDRLSQGERRLYHREVAEALESLLLIEDRFIEGQFYEITGPLLQPDPQRQAGAEDLYLDDLDEFGPSLAHHFWQGELWGKATGYLMHLGKKAMKAYALREAIEYYERALQALEKAPEAPREVIYDATMSWVEAAFKFRPYSEQLQRLSKAETIARDLKDKPRLIEALHWTANVHLARGLWGRAEPALTECFSLAEELGIERLAIRPTYFKAVMTAFVNPRQSLALLERTLELARHYGDRQMEAFAFGTKGQVHAQLGEFAPARESMQRASEVVSYLDSPLTESDVDLFAAWTYLAMGDTQRGLEYGRRSLAKAIGTDNMDCICYAFDCVGYGYLQEQKIAEAALAFEEAINRSDLTGATVPKLLGQAGLAAAQFYNGRTEAIKDLETVLVDMQTHDNQVGVADVAHLLGTCFIALNQLERAESYLNMALAFYRRTGMRPYIARTLASLTQLFDEQGRHTEAQDARTEAEMLLKELEGI